MVSSSGRWFLPTVSPSSSTRSGTHLQLSVVYGLLLPGDGGGGTLTASFCWGCALSSLVQAGTVFC